MKRFTNFLERLSLRIAGFLMIVIGTLLMFFASCVLALFILERITDLMQKWLPEIPIGIEIFVGSILILLLPAIVSIIFARTVAFRYRLLKRRWLMHHGIVVEASLRGSRRIQNTRGGDNRDKRALTFAWKPPHRKREYTFKKTIPDLRYVNLSLFPERPFIVIFDPDAPTFYDIQLQDEAFPLPDSITPYSSERV